MIPATNKLNDVLNWLNSEIQLTEEREKKQVIRLVLEDLINASNEEIMFGEKRLTESQIQQLQKAIKRLNEGEPIQYITGISFFHELKLKIDARALIPRPETEELVELCLEKLVNQQESLKIMDLCSGSGCIALALKNKCPRSEVYGLEKSKAAIELAKDNGELTSLAVNWLNQDIFDDVWPQKFKGELNLMVSNPPYIPHSDKVDMSSRVLEYEPDMALFVENDRPLIFYERLANLSAQLLKENGLLVCEVHEERAEDVVDLFLKKGLKFAKSYQDLQGKDRMVCGIK